MSTSISVKASNMALVRRRHEPAYLLKRCVAVRRTTPR